MGVVAHTCNPSYSGDRDEEDRGLKPAWEKSLQDPIFKIFNTKKGLEKNKKDWRSG
jgi:hypothetical protein